MNRVFPKPQLTPFEADYARWCKEQAALLRNGQLDQLDRENLAEEIETLGRSEKREIESRLQILLIHLLKWKLQPSGHGGSWQGTIREQRLRLTKILKENPSLKTYPAEVFAEEYEIARLKAAGETGVDESLFPLEPQFSIDQVLDLDFLPEA